VKRVAVFGNENLRAHAELIQRDTWIIDGYGCTPSSWERFGHLAPKYRKLVVETAGSKRVHHLKSPRAVRDFVAEIGREFGPR